MPTFQVTDDVYGIDVGMFDEGVTSVYLFDDDEPALVDAGTAAGADRIREGIAACGVAPEDLEHIVLSHIHVDHSGAASSLVETATDATVYIHEATAPHLIDPSGLVESSRRAMGEHFEPMGEQGPVPEDRVVGVPDSGTTVDTGEASLELRYGPGHSPDHFAVWVPERGVLFAAECLGIYLARADRWIPPSTLPNFDVDVLAETIDRLRGIDPERIVFPHFGEWPDDPDAAFETAESELDRFDTRIRELYRETNSVEETKAAVADELIDASPPYDQRVESFYASLVTDGFLKHHDLL